MRQQYQGKISTFGGPDDKGVGQTEGLALIGQADAGKWWFSSLFLTRGSTGYARGLNPDAYYIAMRWNYAETPKNLLRRMVVRVCNPANGRIAFARPVDYGPGDGTLIDGNPTRDTGRIADLSPGLAAYLGLETDDVAVITLDTTLFE